MATPWSEKSRSELAEIIESSPDETDPLDREGFAQVRRMQRARVELVKRAMSNPTSVMRGLAKAVGLGLSKKDGSDKEFIRESKAQQISREAKAATDACYDPDNDDSEEDHKEAYRLHLKAADLHDRSGNEQQAAFHREQAAEHRRYIGKVAADFHLRKGLRVSAEDTLEGFDVSVQTRGSAPQGFQGARVTRFATMSDEKIDSIISLGRQLTSTSEPHDFEAANDAREAFEEKMRRCLSPKYGKRFTVKPGVANP